MNDSVVRQRSRL